MSEQGKRVQRRKQEDAVFNRMLLWLAGTVGLELISLLVRRLYINFDLTGAGIAVLTGLNAFFKVFRFAGIVLFLVGCVWTGLTCRKKGKVVLPLSCTGAVLWLWVISFLSYTFQSAGVNVLCFLPAVLAVLVAVFFLYQRDFFYNVVLAAVGMGALWVYRQTYMTHPRMLLCGFAVVWILSAFFALAAFRMKKQDGKLFGLRLLPAGAGCTAIFANCAVVAVALLAALIFGVAAAYYILAALGGWLFCLAVYYTVKLM